MVATPLPLETGLPATDSKSDEPERSSETTSTNKKRKAVSFAALPAGTNDELAGSDTSADTAIPSLSLASGNAELKAEMQNPAAAPSLPTLRSSSLSSVEDAAPSALTPPLGSESDRKEILSLLSSIRDILSDEESVASSVSSLASDTPPLSERPTRGRRRGRGRRGRGKKVVNQEQTKGVTGGARGGIGMTRRRGGRRRRGRGGRVVPELTRSASVETVEESRTAAGKCIYLHVHVGYFNSKIITWYIYICVHVHVICNVQLYVRSVRSSFV